MNNRAASYSKELPITWKVRARSGVLRHTWGRVPQTSPGGRADNQAVQSGADMEPLDTNHLGTCFLPYMGPALAIKPFPTLIPHQTPLRPCSPAGSSAWERPPNKGSDQQSIEGSFFPRAFLHHQSRGSQHLKVTWLNHIQNFINL